MSSPFFATWTLTPSLKLEFAKQAIAKGYRLEVFDIERLRSVLDASLKEIRRRFLKIDDEVAARLRSEVKRLLRFPDATADKTQPPTLVEKLLADQLPRRLFDLLMAYEERDILEVPGIGGALQDHLEGRLNTRRYADREGTEHSVTEVIARELRMLDSRKNGETVPPESQLESPEGSQPDPDWDDDIAF